MKNKYMREVEAIEQWRLKRQPKKANKEAGLWAELRPSIAATARRKKRFRLDKWES